jgi:hypothetical protein
VVSGFQSFFLAGDEGPSRGPKFHDCGRGLQIISRSRDEVLGFELFGGHTPVWGGYQQWGTDARGL